MKYYEVEDLAEMFHVHKETIKREIQRHRLKCFKVGSEIRISQEHVDEYTNVLNSGKTTREIELEKMIDQLNEQLDERNIFIDFVKKELIKLQ